jgi:Tol biopolymer transport system component
LESDRLGRQFSPKRTAGEAGTTLAVSQDGRHLAYSRIVLDSDIWGIKLRSRTELAGLPPAKLISSTRIDCNPEYSPDGKLIAFNLLRSGALEVWMANADGTNQPDAIDFRRRPDGCGSTMVFGRADQ